MQPSSEFEVDLSENLDDEFLLEFRRAGLDWVQYASVAASILVMLFIVFPRLSNHYSLWQVVVRGAMLFVLLSVIYFLRKFPEKFVEHYVRIVSCASGVSLIGVVVLIAIPAFSAISADFSPIPAMFLGLIINYGFLRLPLKEVSSLCWSFSIIVLICAPQGFVGLGQWRLMLYLVALNILGMLLSRSIESRERQLFEERRRSEILRRESSGRARSAREAHAEKTRLIAAVSHDLRQPMAAASAGLEVLRSKIAKGDLTQAAVQAEYVFESIKLLGASLEHLLTAARYESGNVSINVQRFDLAQTFLRLERTFSGAANSKGIELRIRMPEPGVVVDSDVDALWQMLLNLVSNAIKFTDSLGRTGRGVVVRAFVENTGVRVDVADTGIGLSPDDLVKVWRPYAQAGNLKGDSSRGLGLGLFLVRRVLGYLPGHVLTVRSRVGGGTRFTLRLPGTKEMRGHIGQDEAWILSASELALLKGAYVAVLEDDAYALRAILGLLDDWGVIHSSGGTYEELIGELRSDARPPDVLVSDYRLAEHKNGAQCIVELRRYLKCTLPAVLISGESDLDVLGRVAPLDTVLLRKPFEAVSLAAPIIDAVQRARRNEST